MSRTGKRGRSPTCAVSDDPVRPLWSFLKVRSGTAQQTMDIMQFGELRSVPHHWWLNKFEFNVAGLNCAWA